MVPPVTFEIPEERRRGVIVRMIAPSGTSSEMVSGYIVDDGWTLKLTIAWPEWFLDFFLVRVEANIGPEHRMVAAHMAGLSRLRPNNNEPVLTTYLVALPIQVEQDLPVTPCQCFGIRNPDPNPIFAGQYCCYFKISLRTRPHAYHSSARTIQNLQVLTPSERSRPTLYHQQLENIGTFSQQPYQAIQRHPQQRNQQQEQQQQQQQQLNQQQPNQAGSDPSQQQAQNHVRQFEGIVLEFLRSVMPRFGDVD